MKIPREGRFGLDMKSHERRDATTVTKKQKKFLQNLLTAEANGGIICVSSLRRFGATVNRFESNMRNSYLLLSNTARKTCLAKNGIKLQNGGSICTESIGSGAYCGRLQ